MMNAYSWDNIDEMNGYKQDARLTFVGDFATHKDYFKEKKGKFDCVKNRSERIFVLRNKFGTNFELPYIMFLDYLSITFRRRRALRWILLSDFVTVFFCQSRL